MNGQGVGVLVSMSWQREHKAVALKNIKSAQNMRANSGIKTKNAGRSAQVWLVLVIFRVVDNLVINSV